jgi:hypothetical protein
MEGIRMPVAEVGHHMTLREWAGDAVEHVRSDGWAGARKAAREFYVGTFRQVGRRLNYGRRIYETDWDLLVVLDACRWDLLAEVADEYVFVDEEWAYSCASASGEWHRKTFREEYAVEMRRTALVSANPYTEMHVDGGDFLLIDEVWRDAFDEEIGTIPAERVVDRTIRAGRQHDPDRLVAHFMQPHYPFVPDPLDEGIALGRDHTPWDTVWDRIRKGTLSRERAWSGYRENLRYALDHVETLLENVDAERVVITADHGNLLGEFGLYAHPQYVPIPALKRVPWCVTSATDEGRHEPAEPQETTDVSRDEQLEALGYK